MLHEIIKTLQTTKGTNAKLAVLQEHKDNKALQDFLKVVYEPTYSYYVTKIPEAAIYGDYAPGDVNLTLLTTTLHELSTRSVTGFAAKQYITNQVRQMNKPTFDLFVMAINRDIKASVATTAINKTWPGHVTVVPYQRCVLPKDSNMKNWKWGTPGFYAYSQIKADGMYANVNVKALGNINGFQEYPVVEITSRNGSVFPGGAYFDKLIAEAIDLSSKLFPGNTQLQGELLVKYNGVILPREKSNGVMNSILQTGENPGAGYEVTMVVWDAIPLNEATTKNVYEVPYSDRYNKLETAFKLHTVGSLSLIETVLVTTYAQAASHFLDALKRGLEGTIVKHKDAFWLDGDNKDQVKGKLEFVVDLVITGFNVGDPNGKHAATFGSLQCETSDGLLVVGVSGMSDAVRLEIHNNREYYLGKIVSIMVNDIMFSDKADEPHSLFLPRLMNKDKTKLVDLRLDKEVADTFVQVVGQYEAAKAGANL